jgi:glycosyltransferase involved in cell wall biosynthesis
LGRVILEAHLLGVPVIVPDKGGPAEIVENDVTGLTFPSTAGDAPAQLAHQVTRLLQDDELRKCLASAGQRRIYQTYASRHNVETLETLINTLASSMKVSI